MIAAIQGTANVGVRLRSTRTEVKYSSVKTCKPKGKLDYVTVTVADCNLSVVDCGFNAETNPDELNKPEDGRNIRAQRPFRIPPS